MSESRELAMLWFRVDPGFFTHSVRSQGPGSFCILNCPHSDSILGWFSYCGKFATSGNLGFLPIHAAWVRGVSGGEERSRVKRGDPEFLTGIPFPMIR